MRLIRLSPLLLSFAALLAVPATAPAAARCTGAAPSKLAVHTSKSGTSVMLRWRGAKESRLAWRIARDGKTVGQTRAHRMKVRVTPGKRHKLTVTAFVGGRKTSCSARLRLKATKPAARSGVPAAVTGLSASIVAAGSLRVSWEPPKRGGTKPVAYRVLRDGRTLGHTKTTFKVVTIALGRSYRVQVAAVGSDGRIGPLSSIVTVASGHTGPSTPAAPAVSDVGDTTATLSWGASTVTDGAVASYRVLRDGRVSHAVRTTTSRLTKLASARRVTVAVQAVDSMGWTSPVSDAVTLETGHHAPGAPGAPVVASVTDTQLHLNWQPGLLPEGSALRGYRLLRDGVVTGQSAAAEAFVGNLAPLSRHTWSVAAVDSLGYVSAPSPALLAVQAAPPGTSGSSQAFLLASTDSSFAAFQRHYRQIGVVYPTYYDCDISSGAMIGQNDPLVTRWSQERGVKVLPRINCQNTAMNHRILNEPALRAAWLDAIVGAVRDHGYDGVNIDFEAVLAIDRDPLTSFITELAGRLHGMGKLLSQAVSAKAKDVAGHPRSTAFDYVALSEQVDWVFVMAWGIHWATSAPGAQDDIRWVTQVANYVASLPRKQKFVMGTMLYAMDWPAGGGAAHPGTAWHFGELAPLMARTGSAPTLDAAQASWHLAYTENGVSHDVYYSDAALVELRLTLARSRGLGVGFWRIGQEDERLWDSPLLTG